MQYGRIEGLDKPVPRVIYGAQSINEANKAESFALLDEIVSSGGTAIDTAHAYSGGDSERVLGEWMRTRSNREDLLVMTKGAHHNSDRDRVTPFDVTSDLHDSLARLQTDYVDIYFLHRDDPTVPVAPIIDILNRHVADGKMHLFGASNWRSSRIEEANAYASSNGLQGFSVSSVQFSLAVEYERPHRGTVSLRSKDIAGGAEDEGWYRATEFPLLTWSSLARGLFSGKITRDNAGSLDDLQLAVSARCYGYDENFRRLDRASEIAAAKGKTVSQIAIAFLFAQPTNLYAITGSRNPEHFRSSIDAWDIDLSLLELDWLDLKTDTAPFDTK